jgi:hypothetical protein
MRLSHLAIGICVLPMLLSSTEAANRTDHRALQVAYELVNARAGMLLHVRINDTPALMILDTGSTHTIIQPRVLGSKAPKVAPAHPGPEGVGFIGDGVGYEVQLQVGEWKWKRCTVVVMDLARVLAVYNERVDGLLGLDFVEEFSSILIDRETRTITFRK